ncbi:MAG: F0F1 ATP synthase subunit delta [Deltaproteobacteria bacterium]
MVAIIVSMIVLIIIVFIGLVVFMQKVFSREVTSATSHLDKLAEEYAQKEEAIRKQFEEAKRQSQEIIANAQKDAAQQKDAIAKQATEEKEKLVAEAHHAAEEVIKQADNARLALLAEADRHIDDRAVIKAAELLEEVLPEDLKSRLHVEWVTTLIDGSFENLDRLNLKADTGGTAVASAFPLTQEQRDALKAKLKEKLGFDPAFSESVDPALIAGLVVNIGSVCLDGSLRFKIQEVARGKR